MLNGKGEWVYTSSELGRLINVAPATIVAVSRRLLGAKKYEWTLQECVMIKKYIDTAREEYAAHMAALSIALGVEVPAEEDDAI